MIRALGNWHVAKPIGAKLNIITQKPTDLVQSIFVAFCGMLKRGYPKTADMPASWRTLIFSKIFQLLQMFLLQGSSIMEHIYWMSTHF